VNSGRNPFGRGRGAHEGAASDGSATTSLGHATRAWMTKTNAHSANSNRSSRGSDMTDEEHCNTGTKSRRVFRSQERAELAGAIADTRTMFEGKGWA
jgi:hypothetical protein